MPVLVNENEEMAAFPDHLSLRSNEVQEFVSHKPNFIVRWGTTFFFFVLAGFAVVCWFIQYPDLVTTKASLNSINAPKEVVTRTEAKLQAILVKNGDSVSTGALLGYLESIAKPDAVIKIKKQTDSVISIISQNKTNEIINYFPDYTQQQFLNELGELQQPFQIFMQSFISFKDFISNGFYLRKRTMLQTDMKNIKRLHAILTDQKELLQKDLALSSATFSANESLAKEKVISAIDYRNEQSKLIARQLTLPQINSAIVTNESHQNEKNKEIADIENQILVQKSNFIQALQTFNSHVLQWEYKYMLKAPIAGKVSFTGFFQENQHLKNSHVLFYIQPANTTYFAEILVPQYNFGKVKTGQEVLLKFLAYPHEQFGLVTGRIEFINPIPTDSGFLAKVVFPKGLVTNYGKRLQYQTGLLAQGDIITENMRLLERFYYNIKKQFNR